MHQASFAQNGLFENFESFELGDAHNQSGWTTNQESDHNDSFIVNSGIPQLGERSLFHMIPSQLPIFFEIRSPEFSTPPDVGLFFDVLIENSEHEYNFKPWDLGENTQNTILNFDTDGSMRAFQINDIFGGAYFETSGHWQPNRLTRIGFVVTEAGEIKIYQDGALIFTGEDNADAPFGNGNPSGIGQLRIEKGLSFNAGSSSLLIDNISNLMSRFQLGDVNQDGVINLLDVQPFVDLLATGDFLPEADVNGDGDVNLLDVAGFVDLLAS